MEKNFRNLLDRNLIFLAGVGDGADCVIVVGSGTTVVSDFGSSVVVGVGVGITHSGSFMTISAEYERNHNLI